MVFTTLSGVLKNEKTKTITGVIAPLIVLKKQHTMSCYHDSYGNLMSEATEYADLARDAMDSYYEDSEESSDGSKIVVDHSQPSQPVSLMPPPRPVVIKSWTTDRVNKEYIGDPRLTVRTVIKNILNVNQCYEFMREHVDNVTVLENGNISIKTSRSLYAGD
jgi:hypothetical protein